MSYSPRHPSDIELLMANDGELSSSRRAAVDAHIAECPACRIKSRQIGSMLMDATATYMRNLDAPGSTLHPSRVRLESQLRARREEWEQSWIARMRVALSPSAVQVGVAVAASIILLAMWMPRAFGDSDRFHQEGLEQAALPIAALTPGAVAPLRASQLCQGVRPARVVTQQSQREVLRSYRMDSVPGNQYELDALITPELGGTTDPANLWPQRYGSPVWNAQVKDELERLLPQLVCSGRLDLARAQQDIATDWVGAYKRYFKTTTPLRAQIQRPVDDSDELFFESGPGLLADATLSLVSLPIQLAWR